MKFKNGSLLEVAAQASQALEQAGIKVAVVGGSAITSYVPSVYTSKDIDFAAVNGTSRRAFTEALAPLGFYPQGRDFVHPRTRFTLDLVADTPYVDQRPITEFETLDTRYGPVRVYLFEDAIADRIAAFLHWSDSESLNVAERALSAHAKKISWRRISGSLRELDTSDLQTARRLKVALNRLRAAYNRHAPLRSSKSK
jgi:hypothetical protein